MCRSTHTYPFMQCTSVAQHITTAQDHHKTHYDCTVTTLHTQLLHYACYKYLQIILKTNGTSRRRQLAPDLHTYIIIICKTKHERTQTLLVSRIRKQGKTRGYETSKYRYNEGDKYTCRQSSAYLQGPDTLHGVPVVGLQQQPDLPALPVTGSMGRTRQVCGHGLASHQPFSTVKTKETAESTVS